MSQSIGVRRLVMVFAWGLCLFGCNDDDTKSSTSPSSKSDAGHAGGAQAEQMDAGPIASGAGGKTDGGASSDAGTASGPDYAEPANWLCRPGHNDACAVNLDTTIVNADGSTEVEHFTPATDPAIDCFYVYPTVSLDATGNSDLIPGPEENAVVRAQFARFASQCRLFAPMYRQVTLTSLRAALAGTASTADRTLGYQDVLAAFRYYLEHDNQGRGFVLVGHSQGSGVLTQLIKEELDQEGGGDQLIAALLMGTNVLVPKDQTVGGTFQHVPVCTSDDQLGCVVVYASFRANTPPPADTLFARSSDPNLVAACTNPAALGGGAAELHSYLSAGGPGTSSTPMPDWVPGTAIDTPFVSVPGLLSAECTAADTGSYLAITVNGDPADARVDDIVGDVVISGAVQANWGLHLIDAHLTMGNLLDLVHGKAAAYLAR